MRGGEARTCVAARHQADPALADEQLRGRGETESATRQSARRAGRGRCPCGCRDRGPRGHRRRGRARRGRGSSRRPTDAGRRPRPSRSGSAGPRSTRRRPSPGPDSTSAIHPLGSADSAVELIAAQARAAPRRSRRRSPRTDPGPAGAAAGSAAGSGGATGALAVGAGGAEIAGGAAEAERVEERADAGRRGGQDEAAEEVEHEHGRERVYDARSAADADDEAGIAMLLLALEDLRERPPQRGRDEGGRGFESGGGLVRGQHGARPLRAACRAAPRRIFL